MACSICNKRKEKRFCPAVHGRICPQCCGEQREVTLDCPSECVYLQQAREHEKPVRVAELNRATFFAEVDVTEQFLYTHEHLITGFSYALAKAAREDPSLTDSELIAALTATAKSFETLVNSGLYYDAPVSGPRQQTIVEGLQKMLAEYREAEHKQLGIARIRDSEVLRAVVFLLRLALQRTSGRTKSRAFIHFLFVQFPEKQSAIATPKEMGSQLIVP